MPSPEELVFSKSLTGDSTADSSRGRQLHSVDRRTSTPAPPKRAPRSLSKRRSVSNMKGLMPLALSPACSPSSVPAEESIDQRTDGYFPEVLAHDLECSTNIFTAKNMTAGSPATVLPAGEKTRRKHNSCPTRPTQPMRQHSASARVQSLGAIQERDVIVKFLHQQRKAEEPTSDVDSYSETDTSVGAAPPSFRYRQQSITTAATSVASASWKPSSKSSPTADDPAELSWMEIDSDDEEQENTPEESFESLAPRPPTPPDSEVAVLRELPLMEPKGSWSCSNPTHQKSFSVGGGPPIVLPKRHSSKQGTDLAMGRSNSLRARANDRFDFRRAQVHTPTQHSAPQSWTRGLHSREGFEDDSNTLDKARIVVDTTALTDDGSDFDADEGLAWKRPDTVYIRPSPPPSPLPSVQAWLNNSVRPYTPGLPNDDLSRAVPLPPDVIETLRVSIACFPETMLLSSSLTVETIRTYSRKIRHPNLDLRDLPTESPLQSARRSIWRRVTSYKRGSVTSDQQPRDSQGSNQGSLQSSASSSSLEAPQPWMPLKHVFGCCSDYICDALYAHIVAYNYISALVPRNTSQLQSRRKSSTNTQNDSQKDDIPKKAASVLGLSGSPNTGAPNGHRLAKKLSMARLSWNPGKDMTSSQQAMSAAQEQTARDIQAGLMRCIVRLIATAKLMAESGTGEERNVEMDTRGVDVLFTRSLCEIVRISEEVV